MNTYINQIVKFSIIINIKIDKFSMKCGTIRFVGEGELKEKLSQVIEKKIKQENINIANTTSMDQIASYLYSSDVLVLPSSYDSWGTVVNEALQAGCYVIGSEACGACSLLNNNLKLELVLKQVMIKLLQNA